MPGLASAAIGVWVTAGGRHERPEQNGIAHFLEHMAFKGTARRSALQIAEEIEDVGGYINAYTSREMTAYYARVLAGRCAAGAGRDRRHRAEPGLRPQGDRGRAPCHPAGNRSGAGHARRHHLRLVAGGGLSRSAVRAHHPRAGGAGGGVRRGRSARLCRRALRAGPDDPVGGRRRSITTAWWPRRRRSSAHLAPVGEPRGRTGALSGRRAARGQGSRAGAFRAGASRRRATATTMSTPRRSMRRRWAAACPRGLFQKIREERGLCYSIYAQAGSL